MNQDQILSSIVEQVSNKTLSQIEAERLLNAMSRFKSGVPTGTGKSSDDSSDSLKSEDRLQQ